MTYKSSI